MRKTESINELVKILSDDPVYYGKRLGFSKLTDLHNEWLKMMLYNKEDTTLLGHRSSYKTTCLSISIAMLMVLYPSRSIIFIRKTETDVIEIVEQVKKLLLSDVMQGICSILHGKKLVLTQDNSTRIDTNLHHDKKGSPQLLAMGIGGSPTGKHAHYVFTDDIVNIKDRSSKAERETTKKFYQELINVVDDGGRIFNTGTPWHKEDCISELMPNVHKYDVYTTGIMSEETIRKRKASMTNSLFCANYELKHISDDDVIFPNPNVNADIELCKDGFMHIDASYDGADYTAMTIIKRKDGKFYVLGKMWQANVIDCEEHIKDYYNDFDCKRCYNELNADKGFLAKDLKRKYGMRMVTYHEKMNKYIKITTYLKAQWENVYFVKGTDQAYINQIVDFNENAEHDDSADSLACCIRIYDKIKENKAIPTMYM